MDRYDVFISYNSRDKDAALELDGQLRARGFRPWIDVRDAVPGLPWLDQLEGIIESTPAVLVLVGASGLGPWEVEEMAAALDQAVERKIPVVPVFLKGAPRKVGPKSLPLFLRARVGVDLRTESLDRLVNLLARAVTPQRTFKDQEAWSLSTRLEDLDTQREKLAIAGEDTRAIDGEILDVRRQLRKGPQLRPDQFLLDGRFRLVEPVGKGGFGTVWRAYDRKLKRLVAVKVLHGQHFEDRTRRERFFRGSRKMEELAHPNIVRVLESKCEDDDWLFFVMEFVTGGDFNQAVVAGKLTEDEKLAIVRQVGEVLEFAHQRGVIHRDVKPGNILLDEDQHPKLTDFDLVLAEDSTGFTQTQAMLGTLNYAAPEALESPKDAGPPADVYSLASTAIFALLGGPLPRGYYRDPGSGIARLGCPSALAQVLTQATATDPEQRFPSAGAFVSAIEEAAAIKEPTTVEPPSKSMTPAAGEQARTLDHSGGAENRSNNPIKRVVVVVDLSRYQEIAKMLDSHLGAGGVESLNKQISGFIDAALAQVGMTVDDIKVKGTGDGAILLFEDVAVASRFAAVLHQAAEADNRGKESDLTQRHFRIGICAGEVVIGDDVAGIAIGIATRLESACNTGEVLMEESTWADLPPDERLLYGHQEEEIRGKRDERFLARRRIVAGPAPAAVAEPVDTVVEAAMESSPIAPPNAAPAKRVPSSLPSPSPAPAQVPRVAPEVVPAEDGPSTPKRVPPSAPTSPPTRKRVAALLVSGLAVIVILTLLLTVWREQATAWWNDLVVPEPADPAAENAISAEAPPPELEAQPSSEVAVVAVDDPGELSFTTSSYQVYEDVGIASIAVRRTGGSDGAVSVRCNTANGTATAGSDYTATTDTLTWADGNTANKFCTIPITNETVEEVDETINLSLTDFSAGAAPGSTTTAILTILDNDDRGELSFTASSYQVYEDAGTASIAVRRIGGSDGVVSVRCNTANGTAQAGQDYTATTDTLSWANGDTANKFCTISIIDDDIKEDHETMYLSLTSFAGAAPGSTTTTVPLTILANDFLRPLLLKVVALSDNISIVEAPGSSKVLSTMEPLKPYFLLDDTGDCYRISALQEEDDIQGFVPKKEVTIWNTREGLGFEAETLRQDRRVLVAAWESEERIRQYAKTGDENAYGPTFKEEAPTEIGRRGIIPYPLLATKAIDARGGEIRRIHQVLIPAIVPGRVEIDLTQREEVEAVAGAVTFCVVFDATASMDKYAKSFAKTIDGMLSEPGMDARFAAAGFLFFRDIEHPQPLEIAHPMPLEDATEWLRGKVRHMSGSGDPAEPVLDAMVLAQNSFPWNGGTAIRGARRIAILVANKAAKPETVALTSNVPKGLTAEDVAGRLLQSNISVYALQAGYRDRGNLIEVLSTLANGTGGEFYGAALRSDEIIDRFSKNLEGLVSQHIAEGAVAARRLGSDISPRTGGGTVIALNVIDAATKERLEDTAPDLHISSGGVVITKAWVLDEPNLFREEILIEKDALEFLIRFFNTMTDSPLDTTSLREARARLLEVLIGEGLSENGEVQELLEKRIGIHFTTALLSLELDHLGTLDDAKRSLLQTRIRHATAVLANFYEENHARFNREPRIWMPVSYLP